MREIMILVENIFVCYVKLIVCRCTFVSWRNCYAGVTDSINSLSLPFCHLKVCWKRISLKYVHALSPWLLDSWGNQHFQKCVCCQKSYLWPLFIPCSIWANCEGVLWLMFVNDSSFVHDFQIELLLEANWTRMSKDDMKFDSGWRCWGVCATAAFLQLVIIGVNTCYGVLINVSSPKDMLE